MINYMYSLGSAGVRVLHGHEQSRYIPYVRGRTVHLVWQNLQPGQLPRRQDRPELWNTPFADAPIIAHMAEFNYTNE